MKDQADIAKNKDDSVINQKFIKIIILSILVTVFKRMKNNQIPNKKKENNQTKC